jgi:hypothetical protein
MEEEEIMKKLLTALLAISICGVAIAHEPPGETLFAVQFPDSNVPTIDGNDADWGAITLDVYGIFSEDLFSIHGFAGENVGRGELDASSMQIRHLIGWNESANQLYITSRVFDNLHTVTRQDPGKFYWDDAVEYEVSPTHQALDTQNSGEEATGFSYKFAFPELENTFEWFRPNRNLPWMTSGSRWVEVAYGFSGEQFGESTYTYEMRILPIDTMPLSEEATEDQVNIHDLTEGAVIHMTLTVGDVDGGAGDADNRNGMWSTNPIQCCWAGQDVLLTPNDPGIDWGATPTAVKDNTWGQIKAQF